MYGTDIDYKMFWTNPLYRVWNAMNQRCYNKNSKDYRDYGGRGISIATEWRGKLGFIKFVNDMKPRPANMSIDRKDNNEGYSKNNCQ